MTNDHTHYHYIQLIHHTTYHYHKSVTLTMEGPSPTASGRKFDLTKLSRDDILSLTDNKCNDAYSANHWKGQISLPLYPYDGPWKKTPNPKDIAPTEIDFCSYLGGKKLGYITKPSMDVICATNP